MYPQMQKWEWIVQNNTTTSQMAEQAEGRVITVKDQGRMYRCQQARTLAVLQEQGHPEWPADSGWYDAAAAAIVLALAC